jgi:hypothetical protein
VYVRIYIYVCMSNLVFDRKVLGVYSSTTVELRLLCCVANVRREGGCAVSLPPTKETGEYVQERKPKREMSSAWCRA